MELSSAVGCFKGLTWAMQTGCVLVGAELAESDNPDSWKAALQQQQPAMTQQQQQHNAQWGTEQRSASSCNDASALPVDVLMNEFPGDAERCWRRLVAIQGAALAPGLQTFCAVASSLPWVQQLGSSVSAASCGKMVGGAQRKGGGRAGVSKADRELLCEAGVEEWLSAVMVPVLGPYV